MISTLFFFLVVVCLLHSSYTQTKCDEAIVRKQWSEVFCILADGCNCDYSRSRGYCMAGSLHLDLSGCHISTLKGFTKNLTEDLPMIESVNFTDNNIRQLARDGFAGAHFKRLRVLDFTFNMPCYLSSTFGRGVFAGLNELQSLSLTLIFRELTEEEDRTCSGRQNFSLDTESIKSLSENLTELHVTGSTVMHFGNLSHLSILNLGGKTCNLGQQSNLNQLSELNFTRVSLRGCHSTTSLLSVNGVTELLQNVVYLDISCANIVWKDVKCVLPSSLRVLMLDQNPSGFNLLEYCPTVPSSSLNITAASFSSYQWPVDSFYLPNPLDGQSFPVLTRLALPQINGNLLEWTAKILNMTTGLNYLKYLDVSSIKRQTHVSCPHNNLRYHPWFLAEDFHVLPTTFMEMESCNICIPPRLNTLQAQRNTRFPLDFTNNFAPNHLTLVDLSYGDFNQLPRYPNISGLESVKYVVARKAVKLNLSFILNVFPGMISFDLDGGSEIFSWRGLVHANLIDLSLNNYASQETMFPNRFFVANLSESFPKLQNLSLTGNRLKTIDIIPSTNLLNLDLSDNDIYTISPDMRQKFTAHAKNWPSFQLDLSNNQIRCNCECGEENLDYLRWLASSTFVLFDQLCEDGSAYASPADCVLPTNCSEPAMQPYITAVIISVGVLFVVLIITAFVIWYRYQWRIRIWVMAKFTKSVKRDPAVANIFYLSYCTNSEEQSTMAFDIWNRARQNDLGITIKSRYDLLPGEWQNYMISKSIRVAHKVLLLMPDEQYAIHDNSMYEFLLAIKFLDISNVHPIVRAGVDSLEGISSRFPPLLADALKPHCKSIYPTSNLDLDEFLAQLVVLSSSDFDDIIG